MTPLQQLALLNFNVERATDQVKFDTYSEYLTWLSSRKKVE